MKLYLVQHGEARAKEIDPDRALTDHGKADIDRLAIFVKQARVQVGRVMHSGRLRAVQTAERLASAIAPAVTLEACGLINPNDNPRAFCWQIESMNEDTLIVGHLPFLPKLVSHLVIGDESRLIVAYQPGSMVCLERDDDAHWRIGWMMRPNLLC